MKRALGVGLVTGIVATLGGMYLEHPEEFMHHVRGVWASMRATSPDLFSKLEEVLVEYGGKINTVKPTRPDAWFKDKTARVVWVAVKGQKGVAHAFDSRGRSFSSACGEVHLRPHEPVAIERAVRDCDVCKLRTKGLPTVRSKPRPRRKSHLRPVPPPEPAVQ